MGMARSVVAINTGSSSHKYALFTDDVRVLDAHYERTEEGYALTLEGVTEGVGGDVFARSREDFFTRLSVRGIRIDAIGVRVVAPGAYFAAHRRVDAAYLAQLQKVAVYDPAHITPVLSLLSSLIAELPATPVFAVSDSAFHSTMGTSARTVPLSKVLREEHDIARFGYHGLSYTALAREFSKGRVIACHLGSGASVCAIHDGVSVETSMGFSPLSGLIMSSRVGDIDPAAVLHLVRSESPENVLNALYKESGLLALSGLSDDMRVLLAHEATHTGAREAIDAFVHRIVHYIGAYTALMGGLDALVFSGTIGERSAPIRSKVCARLALFGVALDATKNEGAQPPCEVHAGSTPVYVRRTDEAAEVARAAAQLL